MLLLQCRFFEAECLKNQKNAYWFL